MQIKVNADSNLAVGLNGIYRAEVVPEGISLVKGKKQVFVIDRSTPVELDGKEHIRFGLPGNDDLFIKIKSFGIFKKKLLMDIVRYFKGELPSIAFEDYRIPKLMIFVSLLPWGIPLLTLGGVLPAMIAAIFSGITLTIFAKEHLPIRTRYGYAIGVVILSYVFLVLFWLFMGTVMRSNV